MKKQNGKLLNWMGTKMILILRDPRWIEWTDWSGLVWCSEDDVNAISLSTTFESSRHLVLLWMSGKHWCVSYSKKIKACRVVVFRSFCFVFLYYTLFLFAKTRPTFSLNEKSRNKTDHHFIVCAYFPAPVRNQIYSLPCFRLSWFIGVITSVLVSNCSI